MLLAYARTIVVVKHKVTQVTQRPIPVPAQVNADLNA
jgi:hypothetical protein